MEQKIAQNLPGSGTCAVIDGFEATLPIRYCLYARKSSEQDELQALSIDSQINEMTAIAKTQGLQIADVRRESHSAKTSGERPVFTGLIADLKTGHFNGIIAWSPDRLSRNAGDLGSLVDLMDQGLLKEIRTHGQTFSNSPNEKFLLMILCSQAKLENDNKGVNVKRGLKAKCDLGYRPGVSPLGYINEKYNDKGKKKIMLDPERSPIIKEIFEKVGNGYWSGRDVYRWLMNEIKFTTRSGKRLTLSSLYRILECPFYYGEFEFPQGSGKWYTGNHEPLITKELFQKTRRNLEVAPKGEYGVKEFAFTKLIVCGTCGSGITAEEKFKKTSDGGLKKYVYYHCIKKIGTECNEPYLREDEMIKQISELADKLKFTEKGTLEKYRQEVERFNKLSEAISGDKKSALPKKINIKSYVKYILSQGKNEERREILGNMKTKLMFKEGKILIKQ